MKKGGATVSWALAPMVPKGQVSCLFRPASPLYLEASAQGKQASCYPGVQGVLSMLNKVNFHRFS